MEKIQPELIHQPIQILNLKNVIFKVVWDSSKLLKLFVPFTVKCWSSHLLVMGRLLMMGESCAVDRAMDSWLWKTTQITSKYRIFLLEY